MKKLLILAAVFVLYSFSLYSQEEQPASGTAFTFGGEIWLSGGIAWEWDNWAPPGSPTNAYQYIAVDSALGFEAAPSDTLYAYGRGTFSFDGRTDDPPLRDRDFSDILSESFRIETLYTRVRPVPFLAVSGGKRYLSGAYGRFFSPADYLNTEPIDYLDPDDYREGPFSLSAETAVGDQLFLLHLILEDEQRPWEIAVAPQAFLAFGPVETRLGGKLQWGGPVHASVGIATEIFIFRPFAEAGFEFFSDRRYLNPAGEEVWPEGVTVETAEERMTLTLSAGTGIGIEEIALDAYIQYFYNSWGELYAGNFSLLSGRSTEILLEEDRIDETDLYLPGLHYLALEAGWDIFETGLQVGGVWLINLQALSYLLDLTLSYSPVPAIEIALNVPIVLHDFAGEFGTVRNGWKGDFSVTLGTKF